MLRGEILQTLDEATCHGDLRTGHFDAFLPIDARLSVYRDEQHWAILVETVVFNQGIQGGHWCACDMFYCYGDDLPQRPGLHSANLYFTSDGPSGPLYDPDEIMGHRICSSAQDMRIRNTIVPITTDPVAYAAAAIDLSDPPHILGHEMLRLISPRYRRLMFGTEIEICERIGSCMPLLLRLNEWRDIDIYKQERPSDIETYQLLADVIVHRDPSLYRPTMSPNTHWRNWPNAGDV
jgi:hypothetical protein